MKNIILLIITASVAITAKGQISGTIDPTFADNGVSRKNVTQWDILTSFALQPDGKIVAAGYTEQDGLSSFLAARYLPDGSPDPDFGDNGVVLAKTSAYFVNQATAVALQPDGKILVGGFTSLYDDDNEDFALLRFTPEGQLDASFNEDGIVTLHASKTDRIHSIAVLPDGKILVAGVARLNILCFALAQYLPDGTLDKTFGLYQGITLTTFGASYDVCSAMTLQPDGKILLTGSTVKNGWPDVALARYHPNGLLDSTFAPDGKVITTFSNTADIGLDVAVQPDGKILVSGTSDNNTTRPELAMFRYLPNGTLDPTFGGTGKVRSKISDNYSGAETMILRPDGKILVAGSAWGLTNETGYDLVMKQFNPNGTVDIDFGTNGVVFTDTDGNHEGASKVLFAENGKILLAGTGFNSETEDTDLVLARYLSDLYVGIVDAPQSIRAPWIYPNPIAGAILNVKYELRSAEEMVFELFTTDGTLLSTLSGGERFAGEQTEALQLPDGLSNGHYLLNIRNSHGNAFVKVLLQRQ